MGKKTHLGPQDNIYISTTPHEQIWGEGGNDTITASDGGNWLYGEAGDDTLNGGDGKDFLYGGAADDVMNGGDGKDILAGEAGDDVLAGGAGEDRLFGGAKGDLLDGGDDNDDLRGGGGDDILNGGDGDDLLFGDDYKINLTAHNVLIGGGGNDWIYSYSPLDEINAGAGDDQIWLEIQKSMVSSGTTLKGGAGTDTLNLQAFAASGEAISFSVDSLFTISVNDLERLVCSSFERISIRGGHGAINIVGGEFEDEIRISTMAQAYFTAGTLDGAGGDDSFTIFGTSDTGVEQIDGGSGLDLLKWTRSSDGDIFDNFEADLTTGKLLGDGTTLIEFSNVEAFQIRTNATGAVKFKGGTDNDYLDAESAASSDVDTGGGSDMVNIKSGTAKISLGSGRDYAWISSSSKADIDGGFGNDDLTGGSGNDDLNGGSGDDILNGGFNGNDMIIGGRGTDLMTGDDLWIGDPGKDTFVFASVSQTGTTVGNVDIITDFRNSDGDKIDLSAIDANAGTTGDDPFTFIGSEAFMHHAGELRFEKFDNVGKSNDYTWVSGDTNGDGAADFVIQANGLINFVEGDFHL